MSEKQHPSPEAIKALEKSQDRAAPPSMEEKTRRADAQRLRNSILAKFDQKFPDSGNQSDLFLIELLNRTQNNETLQLLSRQLNDFFKNGGNDEDFAMDLAEEIENRAPGTLSRLTSIPTEYSDFTQDTISRYRTARKEAQKAMRNLLAIDTLAPSIRQEVLFSFTKLMARGFKNPELNTGGDIPGGRTGMFYVLSLPEGETRYVWRSDGQVHLSLPPALKRKSRQDNFTPALDPSETNSAWGDEDDFEEKETEDQDDETPETTKEMNIVTPELREKVRSMPDTELMTYYNNKILIVQEVAAKGAITPDILVEGKLAEDLNQANRILNNQITDPEEAREITLRGIDYNF